MKANLFIAGACKSGTSFLHDFLGKHPEICASVPKEPYFFELKKKYRDEKKYFNTYFSHSLNEKYLLDGRHRNMFFNWMPKSIYEYNNESKLIFILRDPVERAFSHWWMWYSRGILETSFTSTIRKEYLRLEKERMLEWGPDEYHKYITETVPNQRIAHADFESILESGLYYEQILKFISFFNLNQILILDFNKLNDEKYLENKLSSFLSLDFKFKVLNSNQTNEAREFRKVKNPLPTLFFVPKPLKNTLKKIFFKKPKIKKKDLVFLSDFYKNDNLKLKNELKLDFVNKWL